jgi:2-hydroxychromene-2-carboxylate isomerase
MRSLLTSWLAALLTSQGLRDLNRRRAELRRRLTRQPHIMDVWLRVDDPYSWLLIQALPAFAAHFGVQVRPHVMLYLDAQMTPHPELLGPLAARDAARLAPLHGLSFPRDAALPDHERSLLATAILLRHEQDPAFFSIAAEVFSALWHGHDLAPLVQAHAPLPLDQTRLAMEARRDSYLRDGHYLSAILRYGGEWYWGIDRLDHLAQRLQGLGLGDRGAWPMPYGRAKYLSLSTPATGDSGRTLTLFYSFRSPYSWVALSRVFALTDHYGLTLEIRPVLPMVMRGLAVPRAKRFYILRDAAREAALHGVPFGRVCDPVGAGVERCMALWPFAEKEGRLREWLAAAGEGIWSQGINAASDHGLHTLCIAAGLDWHRAKRWLNDDGWRERAEANRAEMLAAGSWGVPTLRIDGTLCWGQDRFALLEQALQENGASTSSPEHHNNA